MGSKRQVVETPETQGVDEVIARILDTANGPGSGTITNASDIIKDELGNDVSTTHLTGTLSVSSAKITTRGVQSLVAGVRYRLEIKWDQNSNTFEAYGLIDGED